MKIRQKILAGFLILVAMLLVAVFISIYQFTTLSKSVEALIENNYKTIQACQEMLGALEREDSGILLLLLGKWTEGREMVQSADITFNRSLELARNNVTEEGEDVLIQDLENQYANFKSHWERPIVGTDKEGDLKWYFNTIYESFINTTSAIEKLLILNQESMYASALDLKERAKRALMPGIVAIIAALFFVLMFNVFINAYFIRPIVGIIDAIQKFKAHRKIPDLKVEAKDELGTLTESVNDLLIQLKSRE